MGTYLHGCFSSDGFRSAFIKSLGAATSDLAYEDMVETTLNELALHLEKHLDVAAILGLR
jgi:adenosylcobyric acid synthase